MNKRKEAMTIVVGSGSIQKWPSNEEFYDKMRFL